jgi:hypothetical protein
MGSLFLFTNNAFQKSFAVAGDIKIPQNASPLLLHLPAALIQLAQESVESALMIQREDRPQSTIVKTIMAQLDAIDTKTIIGAIDTMIIIGVIGTTIMFGAIVMKMIIDVSDTKMITGVIGTRVIDVMKSTGARRQGDTMKSEGMMRTEGGHCTRMNGL